VTGTTRAAGVVLACTVGNAVSVTPMVYTVFGLFLIPIAEEFAWPRSAVSVVLLIVAVAGALGYPVAGRLIDRYGARPVILTGNLVFAAAIAAVALVPASRVPFYAAYAAIGIAAAFPSSAMFTKVIAAWFDRHRGLALGIAGGLGNGVGAAFAPVYAHLLLEAHGWRAAYVGIAVAIVLIGFPTLLLLLRDAPQPARERGSPGTAPGTGMTVAEARRTRVFALIVAAIALGAGCMTAVFAHVVPMLVDRGLPAGHATAVLATFSMVTAAWQIGVGFLLDRWPRPWIAAPFYLIALAGLGLLQGASHFPLLLCAGALMGLGLGTEFGILPYFLSRYFGVRHYGAIAGVVYGVIILVQGVTPVLMDVAFDRTGSYNVAVGAIGVGLFAGAMLILALPAFDKVGGGRH
jgi:MFS family permease